MRRRPSPQTVLAIASLGAAVAFVDATIVNIAFPNIEHSFPGTSISTLSVRGHPAARSRIDERLLAYLVLPGRGGRLPNVPAEVAMLTSRMSASVLLIEPEPGNEDSAATSAHLPTKANVLAHPPSCPIAHFACHAATDPADPPNSHLTSAFQLAGFPHVIGTLWQIDDATAVDVANAFYTSLRGDDDTLDTSRAAQALHHTVLAVRNRLPTVPSLWAVYLHVGA